MKKLILFLSLIFLCSCSNDKFPKYVELGTLRIIAIVADNAGKAEGHPGDTFTLTPYLSDLGSVGALTYQAAACVDPGIGYGAEPTCTGNATKVDLGTGTVTGLNAGNNYTNSVNSFSVTVPATILVGHTDIDKYNGVSYLFTYTVTDSLGNSVKSVKRILVSDPTSGKTLNSNPVISSILADGSALGTLNAQAIVSLSFTTTAGSAETYSYKTTSGVQTTADEVLQATWLYSDGSLTYYRTTSDTTTTFTAPETYPSGRSSFILTVVRDGRDGVAIQKTVIHP